MLFNSIDFAIFLPIVLMLYWFVTNKKLKLQNVFLLIISYVFYGWWDWRFLSLIVFSSIVDYLVGLGLSKTEKVLKRKILLMTSIFVNLGFLGFFKYFNFFSESFAGAFTLLGNPIDPLSLNIILPVGISFYTFQTLSYSIDIYKRKLEPTKDIIAFFAFVSFFPQLVAGPIERAKNLLPQFYKKRTFDKGKAIDGLQQILWGLFKKIVIADNCATIVNDIFNNYSDYSGSTLFFGVVFFAFQIYADFSGYSDIAIGTARLFGFNLMRNFAFPYFSRDIAEFWRRWHISLSTWFRDYLYIPIGGSRGGAWSKIRNIFIIFIVSGFWHGANWTFLVWGALHALYFIPLMLTNRNRKNLNIVAEKKIFPTITELLQITTTFLLTSFAWIFFRAENLNHAINYIDRLFTWTFFKVPELITADFFILLIVFNLVEWLNRNKEHALNFNWTKSDWKFYIGRMSMISVIIWAIILWGAFDEKEFIYFQF